MEKLKNKLKASILLEYVKKEELENLLELDLESFNNMEYNRNFTNYIKWEYGKYSLVKYVKVEYNGEFDNTTLIFIITEFCSELINIGKFKQNIKYYISQIEDDIKVMEHFYDNMEEKIQEYNKLQSDLNDMFSSFPYIIRKFYLN